MSALTRTPSNTNFLQPTKFTFQLDRINTGQYFCQSVNIPGVSLGQAPINFPGGDVYAPGNKIEYNGLKIRFLVDEKLQSWIDLHNWFRSIGAPTGTAERNNLTAIQNQQKVKNSPYSDGTLTILSALNNPLVRVKFYNLFPTDLSDIDFDTSLSADDTVTAVANFRYDYFDFDTA
jgi:hypothetical protein